MGNLINRIREWFNPNQTLTESEWLELKKQFAPNEEEYPVKGRPCYRDENGFFWRTPPIR